MKLGLEAGSETVDIAADLGVRGVPINAVDLVKQGVDATLGPLHARGLQVCQIGAFGFNPLHPNEAVLSENRRIVEAAIPMAAETSCVHIVVCGGNYHPSGFGGHDPRNEAPDTLRRIADVLNPLVSLAHGHGIKLSIEPYLKTAINSPARFFELRDLIDHPTALVANVDVTSLYDYRDYVAPDARCVEVCEGFAGAYGLGHIKDVDLSDGFHLHMGLAPLGSSPTDWTKVLTMMVPHMQQHSWLILEHVTDADEARRSLAKLRMYAEEAGVSLI